MTHPVLTAYIEAELRAAGVSAVGGSPAFSPFTHALEKHGAIVRTERPEPEPPSSAAPVAPSIAPVQSTPVVSFDNLLVRWRRITAAKPRTIEATEYAVRDFKKFLGHGDAGRVTKADGLRWREDCLGRNLTNNTFNNRLSMVIQVLEVGVRDGLLPANPLAGLRLPKSKVALRHPYSDVDAVRILTAARKETSPALWWTHWIMAFTGMRVAEVLQLTQDDIRQDGATGLWYIAVHEADAGKSVKNGHARSIPIHPALIHEGLLDYAKGIEPSAPLFPDKKPDRYGQRGGRGWNLVGQWVRSTVGITDTRVAPNHSWRHRMEDELRTAEVPEDVRDAILGHTRQTTGRLYGVRGEALSRLYRELSKVPVPKGLPSGLEECPLAA
ncbi:site-specific integrase [Siccirubricoccus deserti]